MTTATETKIVLTGIARSKGKAAGEAMAKHHRFGWAFNHVEREESGIRTIYSVFEI